MEAAPNKNILIVDSDAESQQAFKSFFEDSGFKIVFVDNEENALKQISAIPFALVIIDILTKGLSGMNTLQNVLNTAKTKNTPTVVVTKYSKVEIVSKCVSLGAKDYIVKPIKPDSFRERLGKLITITNTSTPATDSKPKSGSSLIDELAEKLKNDELDFSVMPQLGYKIIELLKDEKTPLHAVTELIEKDPGIYSRILKAANSPVYAAAKPVYNPKEAILRIGVKRTVNYVLVISSARLFKIPDKTYEQLLKVNLEHALSSAIVARELGQTISYPDPDNLFAFGLLHDIGKVLLLRILNEVSKDRNITDPQVITEILNKLHTRFGATLMKKWNFPKEFHDAVLYHHDEPERGKHTPPVVVTSLANIIAHEIDNETLKENTAKILRQTHFSMLGIKSNKLDQYQKAVKLEMEMLKSLID